MGHGPSGTVGRRGIQLGGRAEQSSYVPAPGRCAQEFENAAILSLVTTFLPPPLPWPALPRPIPSCRHPQMEPGSSVKASLPFALVSLQVAGCVLCAVPRC